MTTEEERELYAELVLQCAESVPRGRVTTYGAIADVVGQRLGRGGPRLVGNVMATHGAAVRVVAGGPRRRVAAAVARRGGTPGLPRGGHAAAPERVGRSGTCVPPADPPGTMSPMLYTVAHGVIPPLARAVWRPKVEGLHHVPTTGPVIVASNHLSLLRLRGDPGRGAAQGRLPRQVRLLHRHRREGRADAGVVRGARHAAGRPRRHQGRDRQPRHGARGARARARRSASTPRAPARATAGSTAAAPASRTSR